MGQSIVNLKSMGDAFRNTGYKSIESAVSEIIDNSIEAQARNIFIILSESINAKSGRKIVTEIAFLDNGVGMNYEVLSSCLGIGSTTRKARRGMGRFGVGLPQASLYACPSVVVYSWQEGIENCKKVSLDINKVTEGTQTEIEDPTNEMIPKKYLKYIEYQTLTNQYDFKKNGTLVIWENCDRVAPKTRGPLCDRLEFTLGQKFRYFISKGISNIKIICDENQEAAIDILPNDPLFLMEKNYVLGNPEKPSAANIKKNGENLEPFFELYSVDGVGNGEVMVPVKYYDKNGNIADSTVMVRFSIVKSKFYDNTAFPTTNPGNGEFGKKIAGKMQGISIIRANREIDFGKFDYYKDVNEPQHRWWGCEIIFNPELDEAFGVSNNKQYVDLKAIEEDDIDYDADEVLPMWVQLKDVIAPTIASMYKKNEETRKSTRTYDSTKTPSTNIINIVEKEHEDEFDNTSEGRSDEISETEKIEIGKEELKKQGIKNVTDEQSLTFLRNKVNFEYKDCSERGPAFDYKIVLDTLIITINTSHKLYSSFLNKIYNNNKDTQTTFELFLASIMQSIKVTNTYQKSQNDKLVGIWYSKLNHYIDEQLNPREE